MKILYWTLILVLIVVLVVNIIILAENRMDRYDEVEVINPFYTDRVVTTTIYFVEGDHLVTETRDITVSFDNLYSSIIESYSRGSKVSSDSRFPIGNLEVLGVEVKDNIIYLNLSKEFLETNEFTAENFNLYLMSLVNTLTESREQMKVQLLFDGAKELAYKFQKDLSDPLRRDESLVVVLDDEATDFIRSFMDLVFSKQLTNAYSYLSIEKQREIDFETFRSVMLKYLRDHEQFERNLYLTKIRDDKIIVSVYFSPKEVYSLDERMIEEWEIVKINEDMFINLVPDALENK